LGCCASKTALDASEKVQSLSDLQSARASNGVPKVYAGSTEGLTQLMRAYIRTEPNRQPGTFWKYVPDPPQHIWTNGISRDQQPMWDWQEPAVRIRIRRQTGIHRANQTQLIEDQLLLDVSA